MSLPPELSYTGIDRDPSTDLTRRERKDIINAVNNDQPHATRLTHEEVGLFFQEDFDPSWRKKLVGPTATAAALIGVAVANETVVQEYPDLDGPFHVPHIVHTAANVWSKFVPGELDAVTPDVLEHTPLLWLTAAVVGFGAHAGRFVSNRSLNAAGLEAQTKLREKYNNGEIYWDMSGEPDSILVYSATGHSVADAVAAEMGQRTIHIAPVPVPGQVFMRDKATREETQDALRRADVTQVTQLVISPNAVEDEVFPPTDPYDESAYVIGIPKMETLITLSDKARKVAGKPPLPVVILGSNRQPVITHTATDAEHIVVRANIERLGKRMGDLALTRDGQAPITIIDTANTATAAMHEIAGDRPMRLAVSPRSFTRYGQAFAAAIKGLEGVDAEAPPVYVLHNTSDPMSEREATRDNIVLLRDGTLRPAFMDDNIPPERVLVVKELTGQALRDYYKNLATGSSSQSLV